jgi:hypothetical protein
MADIISNLVNEAVPLDLYDFDPGLVVLYDSILDRPDLPAINNPPIQRLVRAWPRRPQTVELLNKLRLALRPCQHVSWLAARGIVNVADIYDIDCSRLSAQDLLDLYIFPDDHIIADHGLRQIEGPVFIDERNGQLVGVCIRNVSADLDYVKVAKYTFSNFGWYLFGYDLYDSNDLVYLVEGVFDALAMRHYGRRAIACGSCCPHEFQLACLVRKFKRIVVCFDNDFWGHYGAYQTARLIRAPVVMPTLKDVSCHFESKVDLKLLTVSLSDLRSQLCSEIADYNQKLATGSGLIRNLPYN